MGLIVLVSNPGSSHTLGQTGPAWGHGEASACVRPLKQEVAKDRDTLEESPVFPSCFCVEHRPPL